MPTTKILITYLTTLVTFIATDALWLSVIAKDFYKKHLGKFLSGEVNLAAAGAFYVLMATGIMIFVILPNLEKDSLSRIILYGALFGLFTYMTYELTNLAALKDWPMTAVIIDIAWGMFITALAATVGFLISKKVL